MTVAPLPQIINRRVGAPAIVGNDGIILSTGGIRVHQDNRQGAFSKELVKREGNIGANQENAIDWIFIEQVW